MDAGDVSPSPARASLADLQSPFLPRQVCLQGCQAHTEELWTGHQDQHGHAPCSWGCRHHKGREVNITVLLYSCLLLWIFKIDTIVWFLFEVPTISDFLAYIVHDIVVAIQFANEKKFLFCDSVHHWLINYCCFLNTDGFFFFIFSDMRGVWRATPTWWVWGVRQQDLLGTRPLPLLGRSLENRICSVLLLYLIRDISMAKMVLYCM